MTKSELELWYRALCEADCVLLFCGDKEGAAFVDEWAYLIAEFVYDLPIQRKPY